MEEGSGARTVDDDVIGLHENVMCGLTGFWSPFASDEPSALRAVASGMADTLVHRGPDDQGEWLDPVHRIVFAHRRLSVIDLSPAGHQPMLSSSGRWVVVFNGEIYNHSDLRRELESARKAPHWRGHSDTETLLAGFDAWGVVQTLRQTVGMFALAIWDREETVLTLARDRLGEKPLYYGRLGSTFLFGSELKSLCAHPEFHSTIDRGALALLMRHGYIPAPYTIYQDINKLMPGTCLSIGRDKLDTPHTFWSADDAIIAGLKNPFDGPAQEAVDALEHLLSDAVSRQMTADVPIGAFLSGGIDSSTIVALMRAYSSRPVKTFSIGLREASHDEAGYARAVAQHLDTDHTELYVTSQDALDVISGLPHLFDEPFADPSQIPTFLVSRLARGHVTVSLTGDAGDELFAGYKRYAVGHELWTQAERIPRSLRGLVSETITALPPSVWNAMATALMHLMCQKIRISGDQLYKRAALFSSFSMESFYKELISQWPTPEALVVGGQEPPTVLADSARMTKVSNFTERMMALDAVSYLPDDILVKVDRAAMGVGLETRIPFLDHRVFEFAWRLPMNVKFRNQQTKWILRQVLYRYVPRELIERPKKGFGLPIDTWLRGPLREWAEDLLGETRLRQEGFLHAGPIRKKWLEHQSGKRNWRTQLWNVLMFQAWKDATPNITHS